MGQLITRSTVRVEKTDINEDYQTYGDGDGYVTDGNGYYQPSDYDELEETDYPKSRGRFTPPKVWIV